jgi:glutathione peroxidase
MFILRLIALCFALTLPFAVNASVYDKSYESIDGSALDMQAFKGKVTLVAVTATQCGNTHQFGPLQTLWDKYKDKGFVVLGIPTNDFGLEPRQEAAIKEFCEANFNAHFPMTTLSHIKGDKQHPFFKQVEMDLGKDALPGWNFFKYLVNKEGKIIKVFPTNIQPEDSKLTSAVEKELGL